MSKRLVVLLGVLIVFSLGLAAEDVVQAYVPSLYPLNRVDPKYPDAAREQNAYPLVQLLLTLDPLGNVASVEVLAGPQALRKVTIDAVKQWKYQPVIRNGQAVAAYTTESVYFQDAPDAAKSSRPDLSESRKFSERLYELSQKFSRTPEQELADLEQDSQGGDQDRRTHALGRMAKAAANPGAMDKAEAYAKELLAAGPSTWDPGGAIHYGNMVLGRVALSRGDVAKARECLLEAGKTEGSPTLDSFGPNMTLAKELLAKGEKDVVLQYFDLCRKFWKDDRKKLDEWSALVRGGVTPDFGANLLY